MSVAGVILYKVNRDGTLDGRWTHAAVGGRISTERASGGTPGVLLGTYHVEIKTLDQTLLFEGSLSIKQLGDAYALLWSGDQLIPNRRPARFSGIGVLEGPESLVATFQEEPVGDVRKEIEQANAEFGRAFAKGNAQAIAALYTPTAKVFPPNATIVEGRDAIEAFWQAVIGSGVTRVTLTTAEVESFSDTAIETGSAVLETKGAMSVAHGKYVVVWKRTGGAWLLHRDCWNSSDPAPSVSK